MLKKHCFPFLLAGLLILGAIAPAQAAKTLNIEEFVKPGLVQGGSFQLSPNGDYFAIIVPREDHSDLVVFDRASNKKTAMITTTKGEYIDQYWWVNEKRIVATLAKSFGGLDAPTPTGELWGIDADAKNNKYLFGYRGSMETGSRINSATMQEASAYVMEPKADELNRILVGIRQWSSTGEPPYIELAKLDVRSGAIFKRGGKMPIRYVNGWLVDTEGKLRFVLGYDNNRMSQLYYRETVEGSWLKVNDQSESNQIIQPLAYTNDGKLVYAKVYDAKGPAYLVKYDPATNKKTKIYSSASADIGEIFLTADGKDAFAIRSYAGRGGYVFLDNAKPESILTKLIMEQFPGDLAIASSFSRDGRYAGIYVSGDVNPGEYYLYDRDQKKLSLLLKNKPNLDPSDLAPVEPIEFKARDGLVIRGFLTRPLNATGKVPLIVLPHGGPYGVMDQWGYEPEPQLFASRGYAVLQVNFRGSDGYGLDFIDAGSKEWGGKMQYDLTDATRYVIDQGIADAKRVCIYGASYGAYAALMAVATEPGLFRCAIGYAGVYDLSLMQKKGDINDTAAGRDYLRDEFNTDPQWMRDHSPAYLAAQIKAPVLLIHGDDDQRAPPAHAKAMREALIKAGNPPEWIYDENEGHGFFNPEKRLKVYQTMVDFFGKNL